MPQRKAYKAPPMPPPARFAPYTNWTGFYFGLNAGYAWGHTRWDAPPPLDFNTNGGLFGLAVGYNLQQAGWVLGIEADYDWTKLRGSTTCGFGACETRNNWLSTVRARIGVPVDQFLPYVTGGLALGDISASNTNAGLRHREHEEDRLDRGRRPRIRAHRQPDRQASNISMSISARSIAASPASWSGRTTRASMPTSSAPASTSSSILGDCLQSTDRVATTWVVGGKPRALRPGAFFCLQRPSAAGLSGHDLSSNCIRIYHVVIMVR